MWPTAPSSVVDLRRTRARHPQLLADCSAATKPHHDHVVDDDDTYRLQPEATVNIRIGYKASAEQFDPSELLEVSCWRRGPGFDIVGVSDHFQPWRHNGGHSPAVIPWLGAMTQATSRVALGTSVLTPMLRYHPSIVAQSFATLGLARPGSRLPRRRHGRGDERDAGDRCRVPGAARSGGCGMAEAVELMRRLWSEERVDFEGEYYRTEKATIYDRPDERRSRSSSRRPVRWRPSSPVASATASSARAARPPSCTRRCSTTSSPARSRRGATPATSGA